MTFSVVQSILLLIGKTSFVLAEVKDMQNCGEWEHMTQVLPQCLKPNFSRADFLGFSLGGRLALIKNSRRFFGLIQHTIGGSGNTFFNLGVWIMTFQNLYRIDDTAGRRGSKGNGRTILLISFFGCFFKAVALSTVKTRAKASLIVRGLKPLSSNFCSRKESCVLKSSFHYKFFSISKQGSRGYSCEYDSDGMIVPTGKCTFCQAL